MNAQGPTPPGWYDGAGWAEPTRPPGPPHFPPPPRRHRGLLIGVVVAAVLVLAGGTTALVLLGSDDEGRDEVGPAPATQTARRPTEHPTEQPTKGATDTSNPDPGDPAVVVRRFVAAALAGDCDRAESYMTKELLRRQGGCERDDLRGLGRVRSRVGEASIEPGSASVPVILLVEGGARPDDELTYDVRLAVVDDEWKIHDLGQSEDMR